MTNEEFEKLAEQFYRETRYMAPGKDDPIGDHTYEERIAKWKEWLSNRSEAKWALREYRI